MSGSPAQQGGFDVHTHLVPPRVIAAAEAGAFGMAVSGQRLMVSGRGVPLLPISEPGSLLERIRADGLEGAIVSIPPPLFRPDLQPAARRDYAGLVNGALLEAGKVAPGALRPLAYLPAEDPELAADLASKLGSEWAGAVMGTALGQDLSYASPRFDPLWRVLGEAGLALFIHPGASPDRRLDSFYLANLLGNPIETTVAAASLVFGGVLHRFPRLAVILAHGGGCLAALCGRWQRGLETGRPGVPAMQLAPREAVRRFFVDSLFHSDPYRDAAVRILGADRVLLGSDWPFPMGAAVAEQDLGPLGPSQSQRIRKDNFASAFGPRLHL